MALATYTDLKGAVAAWLKRTDLTDIIPDFITLAEARIARDLRLRRQVTDADLTTVASTQTVALPSDFLELENITLVSSPNRQLKVITPEQMDSKFPANYYTGRPEYYTILGDNLILGPTPDDAYTITINYYQRFTALSTTPTNWLLTNHPGIYLWASLCEAQPYIHGDDRTAVWEAKYKAEAEKLQTIDDEALRSGSAMRVKAL